MEFIKEKDYQEIKRKMNKQYGYFITEECTNLLKYYLGSERNFTKTMFNIVNTLYREIKSNRITWEQGLQRLDSLGGANNE